MGRIYEVRRSDGLRCHDIHTKCHKDWFRHSKVNREDSQTHSAMTLHIIYHNNLNYVTVETKSIVARLTSAGYWIPNNNEIRETSTADFEKIGRLRPLVRVPLSSWRYHDAVLFREMASINYWNLITIVQDVFEKIAILVSRAHMKIPHFLS
jgi:hypothetical protein